MMTHAILDGARVLRLVPAAEPGAVELVEPLAHWPEAPHFRAELRCLDGVLSWHDPRTLEQIRAGRLAALRDERDAVITGGFVCDGSRFDSDSTSQQRLLGALVAAQAGAITEVSWRLYDNSWRLLSGAEIAAVYQALTAHTQSAFTTFKALEAAVLAATTAEGVEAVQWPST